MIRNLDIGTLRAFLFIADGHSFGEAADLVGRSPSAISLQIQRLEAEVGSQVFRRNNRGITMTMAGERLLGYARRLVQYNDETVLAFRSASDPSPPLRFGTTQDFADAALPDVLHRFSLEHPGVELTLRVDRSAQLIEAVHIGDLDLAIATRQGDPLARETVAELQMIWIGRATITDEPPDPVRLALFEAPCTFRSAAIDALAAGGREYKVSFTSPSLSGLRSAALAGLGVTVRTRHLLGSGLADVSERLALPSLPTVAFTLYAAAGNASTARNDLAELCRRSPMSDEHRWALPPER
jgi:DNA-binding transcriptional LysR family regulator